MAELGDSFDYVATRWQELLQARSCHVSDFSSTMCKYGTKGCVANHEVRKVTDDYPVPDSVDPSTLRVVKDA